MSARSFVDTNVLVYAHDASAGEKRRLAAGLLEELWRARTGVVSTQVLQELYVNLRRKASPPLARDEALAIVEDLLAWEVHDNGAADIVEAIGLEERYGVSFWDALILQAANASGVGTLYTEDLNDGQVYGEVRAVNPFSAGEGG